MKRHFFFIGCDRWERPVYKNEDGLLLVDVCPLSDRPADLCTKCDNEFDGEPDISIKHTKYGHDEFVLDRRVTWI